MAGENLNPDPADEGEGKPNDEIAGLTAALKASRQKAREAETQAAEYRGRAEALEQTAGRRDANAPKELSAAELRIGVEEGRMTEDEAEAIKERQSERRIGDRLTSRFQTELVGSRLAEKVDDGIGRYKAAIPEIVDRDSVQFTKMTGEFDFLVSLGHDPKDARTELLAARAAFGSIESIEAAGKPRPRETFSETGGGAEPDEGGERSDGWPKEMPADSRRYYQDLINKRVLPDVAAAKAEWGYKPKHGPRHAA